MRCQSDRSHPTVRSTSLPSTTRISVGTVSMSWCQLIERSASWTASTSSGNAGSSCVYTVASKVANSGAIILHVSQSRLTNTTSPSGRMSRSL